ncbi:NUDIX domain-containing protein [Photobacterium damselae]|uniref:nucleotide triphosphate diphosphatase NUDT15 n=1 Tax=Photobacterium damselae TaxID=38293 RepID=UPI001EDD86F3|nr:NUDIX hydrolase [Photobacterium damselae]MCG3810888.1 NUDIX domain-containing protein [Photobacterium damselae]
MSSRTPMVGIGVIIQNSEGKILIGKRKNSHAPYFSIPGGHLEIGETFEACAYREVLEETGLKIENPTVIAVTNNLETFHESGKHFISVAMLATDFSGELSLREPDKCEGWQWIKPEQVPEPQFDASRQSIACFLQQQFYLKPPHQG